MANYVIPDSMKKSSNSDLNTGKIFEYILLTVIVFSSVTVYHYQGNHKIFEYVVFSDLVCFTLSIIAYKFHKTRAHVSDAIICEFIWIIWLLYGLLFKNIEIHAAEDTHYIQSIFAVLLVLITYIKSVKTHEIYMLVILCFSMSNFIIPQEYSDFFTMESEVAYIKAFTFIVCAIALDLNTIEFGDLSEACRFQIKMVRILWVLIVQKYFLFLSFIVFIPFVTYIKRFTNKHNNISPVLPFTTSDIKKEEAVVVKEQKTTRKKKPDPKSSVTTEEQKQKEVKTEQKPKPKIPPKNKVSSKIIFDKSAIESYFKEQST